MQLHLVVAQGCFISCFYVNLEIGLFKLYQCIPYDALIISVISHYLQWGKVKQDDICGRQMMLKRRLKVVSTTTSRNKYAACIQSPGAYEAFRQYIYYETRKVETQ